MYDQLRLREYVVYRIGSNGANQSGKERKPVALVNASSAEFACKCVLEGVDVIRSEEVVMVYPNQHLIARPVELCPKGDANDVHVMYSAFVRKEVV